MNHAILKLCLTALLIWNVGREQRVLAEPVTIMSWNLRFNNPGDGVNAWSNRKDWVGEIILKNQVEIAGFQEVLVDQLDDLKARLPEMETYGVGRDDGMTQGEFTPIFYRKDRFEVLEKKTVWLSPTPEQVGSKGWDAALPRIASWVKLKDRRGGNTFYVINTHFDHRGKEARRESARMLVQLGKTYFTDHPIVLTGDFNTTPDSDPYDALTANKSKGIPVFFDTRDRSAEAPTGPNSTWNGFEKIAAGRRIDFIFTTENVEVRTFRILEDQREGRFPSDHLPIVTRLELPAK